MLLKGNDPEFKRLAASLNDDLASADTKVSRIKGVIYGASGVGKSVLAAVLAKKLTNKDIIFVDRTDGFLSLRNHDNWNLTDRIKVVTYESIEQLSVLAAMVQYKQGNYDNVGAIIFDDADLMLDSQLNLVWDKRVQEGSSSLPDDKPERPDYLKAQKQFMQVINDVYDNTPGVHLLMTAQETERKNDQGTTLGYRPGFSPATGLEIKALQQLVVRLTAKQDKSADEVTYTRTVQVHPTSRIDAKTRVGFTQVDVPYMEFISTVTDWSLNGKPQENEREATKRDIETVKSTKVTDDDAPVFVE